MKTIAHSTKETVTFRGDNAFIREQAAKKGLSPSDFIRAAISHFARYNGSVQIEKISAERVYVTDAINS